MNESVEHLPRQKQDELRRITELILRECAGVEMIVLFGSYARGDWKDGLHEQGRGRLTIHKKSDYDVLVITKFEGTARDATLWHWVDKKCAELDLSTYVRIIARDIDFVNFKLSQGQYFFTDIINEGITLYDGGNVKLADRRELDPAEKKQIAQECLDEVFASAVGFYRQYEHAFEDQDYKIAAFDLHQACEHSYKTVLLIFGSECPQEHHLNILGDMAADYCPELAGILPRETTEEKKLFALLDYAYIGARYDRSYQITKEELEQLGPRVKMLHEVTEKSCKNKINSFTEEAS